MNILKDKLKLMIKEIAENNDCGMNVFINKESLKMIFVPSEFNYDLGDYEHFYKDDLKEIEENYHLILKIEPPSSNESFGIMEKFVNKLSNGSLQTSLINALSRRRPFANFKHIIDNSKVREDWFQHKSSELEKRVKLKIEFELLGHNSDDIQ